MRMCMDVCVCGNEKEGRRKGFIGQKRERVLLRCICKLSKLHS